MKIDDLIELSDFFIIIIGNKCRFDCMMFCEEWKDTNHIAFKQVEGKKMPSFPTSFSYLLNNNKPTFSLKRVAFVPCVAVLLCVGF